MANSGLGAASLAAAAIAPEPVRGYLLGEAVACQNAPPPVAGPVNVVA
jgi:hypothetical protein